MYIKYSYILYIKHKYIYITYKMNSIYIKQGCLTLGAIFHTTNDDHIFFRGGPNSIIFGTDLFGIA